MPLTDVVVNGETGSGYYSSKFRANLPVVGQDQLQSSGDISVCPFTHQSFVWFYPSSRRKTHCHGCGLVVSQGAVQSNWPLAPEGMQLCPSCIGFKLHRACGLHQQAWFHGKIDHAEADRRLKHEGSAMGDFLVRLVSNDDKEGSYCISHRGSPRSIEHVVLRGGPGDWHLDYRETFPTLQELIKALQAKGDIAERPAIADPDASTIACPGCGLTLTDKNQLFCTSCGARARSSEAEQNAFHAKGREYLQADTTA